MGKFNIKLTDNDGKIFAFSNVAHIDILLDANWCNICYYDSNDEYHEEVGDLPKSIEFITEEDKYKEDLDLTDRWNIIHTEADLPKERDWYLGVFKEPDTDFIGLPYICDYVGRVTKGTTNEGWILRHCTDIDNVSNYFRNLVCVAWKPLPKFFSDDFGEGGTKNE